MHPEDLQARWNEQGEEIFAAVAQWRAAHPHATLAEIEQAVDEQMHRLRARMIEQTAQASAAAESEAREATGMRAVWAGEARTRTSETEVADTWGARGRSGTQLCQLPAVWKRVFSPWIRNDRSLMDICCRTRSRPW
jgi:hypothetical protein